jgi:hypothetical protein
MPIINNFLIIVVFFLELDYSSQSFNVSTFQTLRVFHFCGVILNFLVHWGLDFYDLLFTFFDFLYCR